MRFVGQLDAAGRDERGVGCRDERRAGELRDRDVIGMSVAALGGEGHHDVRPDPAHVRGDLRGRLVGIGAIEVAVDVVEQRELPQAEDPGRAPELGLAHRADDRRPRPIGADPAALAARRGHEIRLDALGGALREHAAAAERLVVRVGENAEQTERAGQRDGSYGRGSAGERGRQSTAPEPSRRVSSRRGRGRAPRSPRAQRARSPRRGGDVRHRRPGRARRRRRRPLRPRAPSSSRRPRP